MTPSSPHVIRSLAPLLSAWNAANRKAREEYRRHPNTSCVIEGCGMPSQHRICGACRSAGYRVADLEVGA